jgi:hypothetical protein
MRFHCFAFGHCVGSKSVSESGTPVAISVYCSSAAAESAGSNSMRSRPGSAAYSRQTEWSDARP